MASPLFFVYNNGKIKTMITMPCCTYYSLTHVTSALKAIKKFNEATGVPFGELPDIYLYYKDEAALDLHK